MSHFPTGYGDISAEAVDSPPLVESPGQPQKAHCEADPNSDSCIHGLFLYPLSLGANGTFVAISLTLLLFLAFVVANGTRRAYWYAAALGLGLLSQIAGYAARLKCVHDQTNRDAYYTQIIFLTIGPAFLAAAIYWEFRTIVRFFSEQHSIVPSWTYLLFLPCDVVSLILQATGGGMTAHAHAHNRDMGPGTHVMIAGLSFQAFTMLIFTIFGLIFALRIVRDYKRTEQERKESGEYSQRIRNYFRTDRPGPFKCFLGSLLAATLLIFGRSVYRAVELSGGWLPPTTRMTNQAHFIAFEGVFVSLASCLLVAFYPGWAATQLLEFKEEHKRENKAQRDQPVAERGPNSPHRNQRAAPANGTGVESTPKAPRPLADAGHLLGPL